MPFKRRKRRSCIPIILLTLACLAASSGARALAQTAAEPSGKCGQAPVLYQLAHYTVEHVTVEPMVSFIPGGPVLDQALKAAIANEMPGSGGAWTSRAFDTVWVSQLEAELNAQLITRIPVGRMAILFARHRLINCDENKRTLDVQYRMLTVARPSYLTNSYEFRDRKDQNKESAGSLAKTRRTVSVAPFAGYNRTRGIFGGSEATLATGFEPLSKMGVTASGSGSSAVVGADFTGSKNFESGPLSYTEWKAAYAYANIPADGFDLKEATAAARFFAATRPVSRLNLILRVGSSLEGGNRQSTLPQTAALPSTVVNSGYGALKFYAGASATTRKHDWKASYGFLLGNTGGDVSVDYQKHIFDTAYRLRFQPKPYKPFQLDVQFTTGSLTHVNGPIPLAERFFGGNVEDEFIQGDSWKIRSNPVIRSFPQNRLNGTGNSLPLGGDEFVSFNVTMAQTIWQKQLIPREISEDPDVNAGLGGQLLAARLLFREEAIQQSQQMRALETEAANLTPTVNQLKALLVQLLAAASTNDQLTQTINAFSTEDDNGNNPIGDVEDAISSAKLDPDTLKKPIDNPAQLAAIQANPVEGNVIRLIKDDPGDPDDPDDDTVSLLTVLQTHIKTLQMQLTASEPKSELQTISALLEKDRSALQQRLIAVDSLRAYNLHDIETALNALNQPAASGRTLDQVLADVRSLLKPERDAARDPNNPLLKDPNNPSLTTNREVVVAYRELLDAADTYADKARSAYASVQDSFQSKDFYGVKIDIERLTVGFGGLFAYLSGLDVKLNEIAEFRSNRGLPPLPPQLRTDLAEAKQIQRRAQRAYNKLEIPKAEATANQTVSYVGRILGVFFRETNLIAISPVVMFDAARLRIDNLPDTNRFRYGIGSGLRFTLINVDFTAGYSFNPTRRLNEPRGAFVLRMDINDIFK
ncbi:MAG TPA: hypothetical protein VJ749_18130 [Pyrinomonadaceae bacterium]|nr:hypothetical protein [Pyrinomonadaceae bacterium]